MTFADCTWQPARANFATTPMDRFGSPKAGISRLLDVATLHLLSARSRREACLASNCKA